jgi:hypothetical protein
MLKPISAGRKARELMLVGFLDPVEDALSLTAGLRRLGFAASFHLGRELAPAVAPGGFHAWVERGGSVVRAVAVLACGTLTLAAHRLRGQQCACFSVARLAAVGRVYVSEVVIGPDDWAHAR